MHGGHSLNARPEPGARAPMVYPIPALGHQKQIPAGTQGKVGRAGVTLARPVLEDSGAGKLDCDQSWAGSRKGVRRIARELSGRCRNGPPNCCAGLGTGRGIYKRHCSADGTIALLQGGGE